MRSFMGTSAPSTRLEAELYDAEIIGAVPREINGSLFRVGGDRYYPTHLEDDIVINGDGLMSLLRFEDGHVDFKSKYVRTARLEAEQKARRRLYGKYRNPYTDDPDAPQVDRDNTGNTYAHWHAGRLFALREDSHPHMIDPETLETRETWDFNGKLRSISVCAHPKLDPVTGEWWGFGLFADGSYVEPVLALQVADKDGNLIREEFFKSPFPGLSHDFAVTREHVIFDIMPLTVDEERMKRERRLLQLRPGPSVCVGHHAPRRSCLLDPLVPPPQDVLGPHHERLHRGRQGVRRRHHQSRQRLLVLPDHDWHAVDDRGRASPRSRASSSTFRRRGTSRRSTRCRALSVRCRAVTRATRWTVTAGDTSARERHRRPRLGQQEGAPA
ncbi:carotenoid oxygenase family protein [Streptomyces sp. L7]